MYNEMYMYIFIYNVYENNNYANIPTAEFFVLKTYFLKQQNMPILTYFHYFILMYFIKKKNTYHARSMYFDRPIYSNEN